MNLIYMYRDGQRAEVDTDHVKTYQNFLDHGWVETPPSADEPAPTVPDIADTPEPVKAAPATTTKGRKAR